MKYATGDTVQCAWGTGTLKYDAKIVRTESSRSKAPYLVHYSGWNDRWDEWVPERRLSGRGSGEEKASEPKSPPKKAPKARPPGNRPSVSAEIKPKKMPKKRQSISVTSSISQELPEPAEIFPIENIAESSKFSRRASPRKKSISEGTIENSAVEQESSTSSITTSSVSPIRPAVKPPTKQPTSDRRTKKIFASPTAAKITTTATDSRISADFESPSSFEDDFPMCQLPTTDILGSALSGIIGDSMESTTFAAPPPAKKKRVQPSTSRRSGVNPASTVVEPPPSEGRKSNRPTRKEDQNNVMEDGPPHLDQEVQPEELAAMRLRRELQQRSEEEGGMYIPGLDYVELNESSDNSRHNASHGTFNRQPYHQAAYYKRSRVRVGTSSNPGRDQMLASRQFLLNKHEWDSTGDEIDDHYLSRLPSYEQLQPATTYSSVNGITVTGTVPAVDTQSRVVMKLKRQTPGSANTGFVLSANGEPVLRTNSRIARLRAVMPPGTEMNEENYHLHVGGRGRFGVVGDGAPPSLPPPDRAEDFTYLPPQIVSDHCYGKMPPSSSTSSTKYQPVVAGGHHFTENYGQLRYGTGRGLARSSGTTVMYSVQQPHSNLIYHREVIDRNGHQVLLPVGGHLRLDDDHVYLEEPTGSRLYDQLHDADVHALTQYVEEEEEDVPEDQAVVQYCVDEDGVVVDDDTVVDGRNSATAKVVNRRQGSERKEEEREDVDNNEATSSLMANSGTIRTTTLMTVGKMPANILADEVEDHDH